jgi:hypothetical protein
MTRLRPPRLNSIFFLRNGEFQLMEKIIRSFIISFREPDIDLVCSFTVMVYITASVSPSLPPHQKPEKQTHLLLADIVPPQLGLNSPSSKYKYSISFPSSVGLLGRKLAVPLKLPLGNVFNLELIFLSKCQIPCKARNTARAANFPCDVEDENMRSMISKDVFDSCLEMSEAEPGRYRGGRTIPVLASVEVDESS